MKNIKKILLIFTCFFMMISLSACSDKSITTSPKDVALSFVDAVYINIDGEKAVSLMSEEFEKSFAASYNYCSREELAACLDLRFHEIVDNGYAVQVEYHGTLEEDDEFSTIDLYEAINNSGEEYSNILRVFLIKSNGQWLVDNWMEVDLTQ